MRLMIVGGVVLVVVLAGCGGILLGPGTSTPEARNATVVDVVDGDTVDVQFPDGTRDTVRLLGVDTPEVHVHTDPPEYEGVPDTETGAACLRDAGERASTAVADRLSGADVRLEFDPAADRRGEYDRLLAYVVQNGTNLNHWLLQRGFARVYDSEFTRAEEFYAAESAAQADKRGLWNCTTRGNSAG